MPCACQYVIGPHTPCALVQEIKRIFHGVMVMLGEVEPEVWNVRSGPSFSEVQITGIFLVFNSPFPHQWPCDWLLAPYWWNRGDYRFPPRLSHCLSVCQSTLFSELFSVVFWDSDLNFGTWICLDIIQIMFEFHHAWPTFTGYIALC